jgi:hypothetical protein
MIKSDIYIFRNETIPYTKVVNNHFHMETECFEYLLLL